MSDKITTVLFDLDGTLLPMDQDAFLQAYLKLMAKKLAPHGYDPEKLIAAIWSGTKAMITNTGKMSNEDAFWADFAKNMGENVRDDEPLFDEYYRTDFLKAQAVCGFNPKAAETVRELKAMGLRTALATNPLFPPVATLTRIGWAGLEAEDFELITTYDNSSYCKPNPDYYREVIKKLGVDAENCIMVGNDVSDDMPAGKLGMRVFLLTECLINAKNENIDKYPHGSFQELLKYIKENI